MVCKNGEEGSKASKGAGLFRNWNSRALRLKVLKGLYPPHSDFLKLIAFAGTMDKTLHLIDIDNTQ